MPTKSKTSQFDCNQRLIAPSEPGACFAVVVLAAGPSTKATYRGRTLVEHATRNAIASGASEVIVVAGEDAETVRFRLRKFRIRVVRNANLTEGISSSIRAGVAKLTGRSQAVVITLADQPRITPTHISRLAYRVTSGSSPIVASAYEGVMGAPCAFAQHMIPALLALEGETGARHLVRSAQASVEVIQLRDANFEVASQSGFRFIEFANPAFIFRNGKDSPEARAPPLGTHALATA